MAPQRQDELAGHLRAEVTRMERVLADMFVPGRKVADRAGRTIAPGLEARRA